MMVETFINQFLMSPFKLVVRDCRSMLTGRPMFQKIGYIWTPQEIWENETHNLRTKGLPNEIIHFDSDRWDTVI